MFETNDHETQHLQIDDDAVYNEMMMDVYYYQRGQILLISLLVLSIATTVALSLIGRSTTDVTISNQISESSRAFSAAEAGIEEALKTGIGSTGAQVLTAGVTYNVVKADIGGAAGVYQFPKKIARGTAETLWLAKHNNPDGSLNTDSETYSGSSIDVCWSEEAPKPAMIITIVYKSGIQYRVARGAYDPDGARASTNKFTAPTATTGGCGEGSTVYKQSIMFSDFAINPATDKLLMLRMQPVYADANLAVNATGVLPPQGNKLESTGTSEGGIARKIVVYQQYRSPPSIFDSVIYSQGSFGQ